MSPRTHGSALFTRGQTQIMTLLTLGTAKEGQRIDDLSLETDRRYMHHYNFPPYSVGETGPHARPEAPRHRPRRARPAGARGGHPVGRGLPVHDPARLRDARVERLVLDGLGVRLDARADGRRRADQGAGLRHRDGPREGGRRLRRSSPTSRARRTTSATWTSRSPGHPTGSPRSRWTSRSPASRREIMERALDAGEGGPRPRSSAACWRRSRSRARRSPSTRRGSRRSRSTPSTSAW